MTARKISDQLGRAKISITQDRYLGRRLTGRQTAEVLEGLFAPPDESPPEVFRILVHPALKTVPWE